MRRTILAFAGALALTAGLLAIIAVMTPARSPVSTAMTTSRPETVVHHDPAPAIAAPAAGAPAPERSREAEMAALIEGARVSYLAIVDAAGMPSDVKARRRLEEFERAVAGLADLGPEAIPQLLVRLEGEDSQHAKLLFLTAISRVKGQAGARGILDALSMLEDQTAADLFLDRLTRSQNSQDRLVLEEVLGRGQAEHRLAIIASASARRSAAFAGYLPGIALGDPDPLVRAQALASAERLEVAFEPITLEHIARYDPDPLVQGSALRLYAAANPDGIPALARTMLNAGAGPETQRELIDLLSGFPAAEATVLLQEIAAASPSAEIREQAAGAARRRQVRARAETRPRKE